MNRLVRSLALASITSMWIAAAAAQQPHYFPLPSGAGPHDVAPGPDGTVWYTAQRAGALGVLDPRTGKAQQIPLGSGSAPHGVIMGPDGAAWVTDGGQNAIVRVDAKTHAVKVFPLPAGSAYANLNTCAFDRNGILWFTGQSGFYGRVDPKTGEVKVWSAPRGAGAYGITATPAGDIYYVSLASSYLAHVDIDTGASTVIDPPTPQQGARRVWSDSKGRLWISEWNSGQVSMYDPATKAWKQWKLPGNSPHAYAVYVDETDRIWLTDFSANAIVRFNPATEKFESFPSSESGAAVRQLHGRPGEAWGAESGNNRLVMIPTK
jgi:virginiamycin B lyase